MKEPSGALLTALAGYFQGIPMASPKSFEIYGEEWVRHPSGTGPYILKQWEHQVKMVFTANPNYFRGKPPIDEIQEVMINQSGIQQSNNGSVDLLASWLPD